MAKKITCLAVFFTTFCVVHGALFRACCCFQSPSMAYSIFRNTISMKMVCGHTHPQKSLPNTTVNSAMKTMPVMKASTKRWMSCGQKV